MSHQPSHPESNNKRKFTLGLAKIVLLPSNVHCREFLSCAVLLHCYVYLCAA